MTFLSKTVLFCLVVSAVPSASFAEMVYINSSQVQVVSVDDNTFGMKYRSSNNNWDQSLGSQTGTSGAGAGQPFISNNLGNNNALAPRTYNFTVSHISGEGFIFNLTLPANPPTQPNPSSNTFSWGTFTTTPPGISVTNLSGNVPDDSFNSLRLTARATRADAEVFFDQLAFNSPTLSLADGLFQNGSVTENTQGPNDTTAGFYTQRLYADVDLADHDWTLSGTLRLNRTSGGGDETVSFTFAGEQITVAITPIPEPGSLLLISCGIATIAGYSIRKRKRCKAAV